MSKSDMSESDNVDYITKIQLSEGENCRRAFGEILGSEEFRGLRELIFRGFGGFELERLEDYRVIDKRIKEGGYERKPGLFDADLDKFLNNVRKLGAGISTLARALSEKTESSYQQFFNPDGCQHCGEKANVTESIVCDTCEGMLHLSCIHPALKEIPPNDWHCDKCLKAGDLPVLEQ